MAPALSVIDGVIEGQAVLVRPDAYIAGIEKLENVAKLLAPIWN